MPALFTSDRVPLLQLHLGIALAAEVLRGWAGEVGGGGGRVEVGAGGLEGWGRVGFAGHDCGGGDDGWLGCFWTFGRWCVVSLP